MGYVLDNKWFSQTLQYIRDVVQLVSMPSLGEGGRQFESGYPDITNMLRSSNWLGHHPFTVEITGSSPVRSTKKLEK